MAYFSFLLYLCWNKKKTKRFSNLLIIIELPSNTYKYVIDLYSLLTLNYSTKIANNHVSCFVLYYCFYLGAHSLKEKNWLTIFNCLHTAYTSLNGKTAKMVKMVKMVRKAKWKKWERSNVFGAISKPFRPFIVALLI